MERQDAIKALTRAGRAKDVAQMIDEEADKASQAFKEVRADTTRTDDYKRWLLAVASHRANRALNEKLEEAAKRVVSTDRNDAEKVFGVRGINGDAASLVISRRDAGDRVAEITSPQELRGLLTRATRTGDEVLARAIAERAMEIEDTATLHQFIADRPELDAPVERLWKAERASQDSMESNDMPPSSSGRRPSRWQCRVSPALRRQGRPGDRGRRLRYRDCGRRSESRAGAARSHARRPDTGGSGHARQGPRERAQSHRDRRLGGGRARL